MEPFCLFASSVNSWLYTLPYRPTEILISVTSLSKRSDSDGLVNSARL